MSRLKKNFLWNTTLALSGYVFPLLTFPYVTRVLGAEGFGKANFAMSVVDYAILFSSLGLATIGYRYIPQCADDRRRRNEVFNHLVTLHIVLTAIVLAVYAVCVFTIPQLSSNKTIFAIGATKIIFNVFLVEWLFEGMQDFRYITLRTLFTRVLYVVGVFLFVTHSDDYDIYFYLTIGQVVLNALINWRYTRRFANFRLQFKGCGEYIFPVFSMGLNRVLLSFYVTFNVIYLEMVCGDRSVGYFSTATRLYGIILSLLSAYNGVFVPYLNDLLGRKEQEKFKEMIGHSFSIVGFASIPVIVVSVVFAPEIILLVAGSGYGPAVAPFRIVITQVVFISLAQILENQILLSLKKFKEVLVCTSVSTALSVAILFAFTSRYGEVAAAYAVAAPHVLEVALLFYYAHRSLAFRFPYREYVSHILVCIPIAVAIVAMKYWVSGSILLLIIGCTAAAIYYLAVEYFVVRQPMINAQIDSLLARVRLTRRNK